MISNFHTSSSGQDDYYGQPAPGAYYTFSGFENGGNGSSNNNNKGKNGGKPKRRGLGARFGRFSGKRQVPPSSSDTVSDTSHGGLSLSYSTGSSMQSAGESTDGSDFSGILKVLEKEDRKGLSLLEQKLAQESGLARKLKSGRSIQSESSTLNYSDTDGESSARTPSRGITRGFSTNSYGSTDYSTDQESQLEGANLLPMLMEDARKKKQNRAPTRLLGDDDESTEADEYDRMFQPAKLPNRKSATTTAAAAKKDVISAPAPSARATLQRQGSRTGSLTESQKPSAASGASVGSSRRRGASSKSAPADGFENLWNCGAQVLDDAVPTRVKTALRPYLCGVI